VNIDTAKCC